MMKFHILTLFPEMVQQGLATSILGRAAEKNLISIDAVNIRDYTQDKHGKVDDYTYGGGAGMLMQAQPVYDAYRSVAGEKKIRCVYLTPQGEPFTQKKAKELSGEENPVGSGNRLYLHRRLCSHRRRAGCHGRGGRCGATGARSA